MHNLYRFCAKKVFSYCSKPLVLGIFKAERESLDTEGCLGINLLQTHTKICIFTKVPSPATGRKIYKKRDFIDYIMKKDYNRASEVLRNAPIFRTTKQRALRMAKLIYNKDMLGAKR